MSACNFSIPFSGSAEEVMNKAGSTIRSQGGSFNGNANAGSFDVSVFGSKIEGSYTVAGNVLNVVIDSKPFLVPCSTIESFLKNKIA